MYELDEFRKDGAVTYVLLLKGGVFPALDFREMREFMVRFLHKEARHYPVKLFLHDRKHDYLNPSGFSVGRLYTHPDDDRRYTAEVRKRGESFPMPSEVDFRVYDEWNTTYMFHERQLNHQNWDEVQYSVSPEFKHKTKAMAGDKFGLTHDEVGEAIKRVMGFLYWNPVERSEHTL